MRLDRIAAVAAHFGRDLERSLAKAIAIIEDARRQGTTLLVLPGATLGGYLGDLRRPDSAELLPSVHLAGPELAQLQTAARDMVVCLGIVEDDDDGAGRLHNTAVCLTGDGVLGTHRKVHQPLGESQVFDPGTSFEAFDTPAGRLGMMIDYDKTFPEAARTLALGGAHILTCLSAWPASTTNRASSLRLDRQSRLFDLYDAARAAENQVIMVSSNQTGVMGGLRFIGQAKVVNPGGEVLAATSEKGGLAVAEVDVAAEIARSRRSLRHLEERVVDSYRSGTFAPVHAAADGGFP